MPNVCTCEFGTAATGVACTTHDAEICIAPCFTNTTDILYSFDQASSKCSATCVITGTADVDHSKYAEKNSATNVVSCLPKNCQCSRGVAATGADCIKNESKCVGCGSNVPVGKLYKLENNTCVFERCDAANGYVEDPEDNTDCTNKICKCDNGVGAIGSACPARDDELCVSCTPQQGRVSRIVNGTCAFTCTTDYTIDSVTKDCVPNICTCGRYGVAKTGSSCLRPELSCSRCNQYSNAVEQPSLANNCEDPPTCKAGYEFDFDSNRCKGNFLINFIRMKNIQRLIFISLYSGNSRIPTREW